jgi:hypothetical protein
VEVAKLQQVAHSLWELQIPVQLARAVLSDSPQAQQVLDHLDLFLFQLDQLQMVVVVQYQYPSVLELVVPEAMCH